MNKKENGITLVALVITIIVLLILAGVSISLVVGDNGILTKTTDAATKTEKASVEEDVEMAWASLTTEYYDEKYTNNYSGTKNSFFTITKINEELQSGTIECTEDQETDGIINTDGSASFTYNMSSGTNSYNVTVTSSGKATATLITTP